MSEFEIVERPVGRSQRKESAEMAALMETATSGQAIRMPLNGSTQAQLSCRWYQGLRLRGYALRTYREVDAVVMWTEKK